VDGLKISTKAITIGQKAFDREFLAHLGTSLACGFVR
jgi:hypothetical protein